MAEDHSRIGVFFLEPVVCKSPSEYFSLMAGFGLIIITSFEGMSYGKKSRLQDKKSGLESRPEIKLYAVKFFQICCRFHIFNKSTYYLLVASSRTQPRIRWGKGPGLGSKGPSK